MHFFIEHNRGHHKRVSTKEDPSSARFGENIFSFWLRAVSFGYLSAWNLENSRLKRNRINIISLKNEMIIYQLTQITFLVLIYFIFGLQIMLYFICCSIFGFLLLETVNYIEHYCYLLYICIFLLNITEVTTNGYQLKKILHLHDLEKTYFPSG